MIQGDCGCTYLKSEQGHPGTAVFHCPSHGRDNVETPLMATHGVGILPWEASLYFGVLVTFLGPELPDTHLDPSVLERSYAAALEIIDDIAPLSEMLRLLARSDILREEDGMWRFTHRWRHDPEVNDYMRERKRRG
jgi:hypothetical protein